MFIKSKSNSPHYYDLDIKLELSFYAYKFKQASKSHIQTPLKLLIIDTLITHPVVWKMGISTIY